jgi:hypothetical protein
LLWQDDHMIAHFDPTMRCTDSINDTGSFPPQDVRELDCVPGRPGSYVDVDVVDGGRADLDPRLTTSRHWSLHPPQLERLRAAEPLNHNGAHRGRVHR